MPRSLKTILNDAPANDLCSALQDARFGSQLGKIPQFYKGAVTSHVCVLPRPAIALLSVRSTAGTDPALCTILDPVGTSVSVGDKQAALDAKGDVVFDADDAITAAEVEFVPAEGDLIEETVPVNSNNGVPSASRGILILREATSLVGTLTGALAIVARGTTPTTGQAAANAAGTAAVFAAADAVTSARIKYIATPGVGIAKRPLGETLLAEDRNY